MAKAVYFLVPRANGFDSIGHTAARIICNYSDNGFGLDEICDVTKINPVIIDYVIENKKRISAIVSNLEHDDESSYNSENLEAGKTPEHYICI
ncbi:MAG: hypothetical protein ABIF08_00770 [Nanoarchaeota archaeon]